MHGKVTQNSWTESVECKIAFSALDLVIAGQMDFFYKQQPITLYGYGTQGISVANDYVCCGLFPAAEDPCSGVHKCHFLLVCNFRYQRRNQLSILNSGKLFVVILSILSFTLTPIKTLIVPWPFNYFPGHPVLNSNMYKHIQADNPLSMCLFTNPCGQFLAKDCCSIYWLIIKHSNYISHIAKTTYKHTRKEQKLQSQHQYIFVLQIPFPVLVYQC